MTYHRGLTGASVIQSLSLLLGHPLLSALLMAIRLTSGVYAKPLPIQRSSGLHDSGVRQDDTPTRSLIVTRWISPFLAIHRYEHTIWKFTQKCHPSRLNSSFKNSTFSLPTHTHTFSFYKTSGTEFKVLSVLAAINVQTNHIQTLI